MGFYLKNFMPCFAFGFFLLFSFTDATEFLFKGKDNKWTIPDYPDEFNKWAESLRFRIGDVIVMKYNSNDDSILQVNEKDYLSCNKNNPIKKYDDGNTTLVLEESGAYYFISGAQGHCEKGQKLEVKVLSSKHGGGGGGSPDHHHPFAPAPSPTGSGNGLKVGFGLVLGSFIGLMMV